MNHYLGIVSLDGFALKAGDVVLLTDGTYTTVKNQAGRLLEHTGGFCESSRVSSLIFRKPPPMSLEDNDGVYISRNNRRWA